MAFSSKSEQRLRGSLNYEGSESTLTSTSYKRTGDMGASAKNSLVGKIGSGGSQGSLYGKHGEKGKPATIAGCCDAGEKNYRGGYKQNMAMEPGELKPGKYSQKGLTTRLTPGKGDKSTVMKTTGTTPKALRGGRVP